MKKWIPIVVVLGLIAVVMVGLAGQYNRMVGMSQAIDSQWSNLEIVYQRRADLIPNLVETVKGYADHERETLEAVVKARAEATKMQAQLTPESLNDPELMQKYQAVQGELGSALGRLMVVIEKYPELRANENFLDLQTQLEGTENRIAVERRRFNEQVLGFNIVIRRFPVNLVAGMFGFTEVAYYKALEGAETAPKVEF